MRKTHKPASTPRFLGLSAVIGLLIVAIGGLFFERHPEAPQPAPEKASVPAVPEVRDRVPPNAIVFGAGSDQLPADATEKLARIASSLRGRSRPILITAQVESPEPWSAEMSLAHGRALAIRQVLQSNGVNPTLVLTRFTQVGTGRGVPELRNRLDVVDDVKKPGH